MSAEHPNDQLTYDEACWVHADNQGLTPIQAILTEARIPYTLEQTGGFTMCIQIPICDDVFYLYVTASETGALIGMYDASDGELVGDDDEAYDDVPLTELVRTVKERSNS
jgi:hypothetical protein